MTCKHQSREKPVWTQNVVDGKYPRYVIQCGLCGKLFISSGLKDIARKIAWPGNSKNPYPPSQ